MKETLLTAIADSIRRNWDEKALSDFGGRTLTYGETGALIAKVQMVLEEAGIKPGDKVALCARNSSEWAVCFLGALSYGAVVVPLLHEFHPDTVAHLVNHCEARVLITEQAIFNNLDQDKLTAPEGVILMPGFKPEMCRNRGLAKALEGLDAAFARRYPEGFKPGDVKFREVEPDSLALINYTSGSMGNSKGVMLSYDNLWSNVEFGQNNIPFLHPGDGMLSMLPLAHMYGLVFEFIFPLTLGCHITFLGRVPSPKIVLQAFASVRPQLVITVPLVIEKIVKGKVFPQLEKPMVKLLLKIPGIRGVVYSKIRRQMLAAFGGELKELILGGAAVSAEVEDFLRRIKFPFTVGYGMTECAPLVTYCWWADQRPHSCGKPVDGMEVRVDSDDPAHIPGVLHVKGRNVMKGYYKNPQATAEVLGGDGWLNTGDICTVDGEGYVYLRGRAKSMILGPSGQNIYPEEIEVKLNNLPLVEESIVVDRGGKIVALVHPDYDAAQHRGLTDEEADAKVMENLAALNAGLPAYSRVSRIEILHEPFEKTPKHSIRRYLYK